METHPVTHRVTYIYVLSDPREPDGIKQLRYVGKTDNLDRRFRTHLSRARHGVTTHCCNWIQQLLAVRAIPTIELLETITQVAAADKEREWISYLRTLGCPLTNLTDGGEGVTGYRPSLEARMKRSAALMGNKNGVGNKNCLGKKNALGCHRSDEAKLKISAANTGNKPFLGRHHSDEAKARQSAAKVGKKFSVEHCAKLSAAHKGKKQSAETVAKRVLANTGKKRSVESLARMSAANKGQVSWNKGKKSSPEAIAKMIGNKNALGNKNRLGSRHSEEAKLKMSVSHRAYWARKKALLAEVLV